MFTAQWMDAQLSLYYSDVFCYIWCFILHLQVYIDKYNIFSKL